MTALRWARILRALGHRVRIAGGYGDEDFDCLVALHARKSAPAAERFHDRFPERPLIVALTGTDVYRDIHRNPRARRALGLASRLVVLQRLAIRELAPRLRRRARVIHQSVPRPARRPRRSRRCFDVCVLGHLRLEKDPLRAALAARRLPRSSRVRVLQVGRALAPALARRARAEQARNPRYRWLGERRRTEALAILGRSRLMVLSSRMEGGANVVSEALVAAVPVLASRIPGSVGLLGARYPGFFPAGDTSALAKLLARAETDRRYYARLARACARKARLFAPEHEKNAWRRLLRGLPETRGRLSGLR